MYYKRLAKFLKDPKYFDDNERVEIEEFLDNLRNSKKPTVRFLVLLMDRYWRRERAIWNRWPDEPKKELELSA